jgi:hypothetical protein
MQLLPRVPAHSPHMLAAGPAAGAEACTAGGEVLETREAGTI